MHPAFRYGAMTPWGGEALKAMGKAVPAPCTGEALEVSVLPGLESRADDGTILPELLRAGGEAMRGTAVGEEFPLLLKLISAKEWLSVQVHPDDAYARANEGGKLGKTEAWVILEAEPGAQIVFGLREGVTKEELERACREGGKALQDCLHFIPVHAGEVYFIPAGTIHALGAGILDAEIQQSSDVTYRFYDWDRKDASGKGRPLHVRQGLDVARLEEQQHACGTPVSLGGADGLRYVDGPAFTLDRYTVRSAMTLTETPEHFRLLLSLGEGSIRWEGGCLPLHRGDSFFLPAMLSETKIEGNPDLLLMAPSVRK